jgi:deoxyribose-phosphate aldolase
VRFVLPESVTVPRDLAPLLEQSVLRPEASEADVLQACGEAREMGLAGVCVRPQWVAAAAAALAGAAPRVVAVVDFPAGGSTTKQRVQETRAVVAAGAREVDVVLRPALLRERDYRGLFLDLELITARAGFPVKVILETCRWTDEQKVVACAIAKAAGAAWVKTSTGFAEGGATAADVALLRRVVGTDIGVKASGGIRTAEEAMAMVRAGADRLGTSAAAAILGYVRVG